MVYWVEQKAVFLACVAKGEGSPTASKSRTPSVKSCLKYEILCCYRDSDSILVLVP